jgi:hypothetical protein
MKTFTRDTPSLGQLMKKTRSETNFHIRTTLPFT